MRYQIQADVSVQFDIEAADPDEAEEKFYEFIEETQQETEGASIEVDRYKVYEF